MAELKTKQNNADVLGLIKAFAGSEQKKKDSVEAAGDWPFIGFNFLQSKYE